MGNNLAFSTRNRTIIYSGSLRGKKGSAISTLNGITSAIQANCFSAEVVYHCPKKMSSAEESIVKPHSENVLNWILVAFKTIYWFGLIFV